eukprot:4321402-Pleurochrysis_carterae.AAC.1
MRVKRIQACLSGCSDRASAWFLLVLRGLTRDANTRAVHPVLRAEEQAKVVAWACTMMAMVDSGNTLSGHHARSPGSSFVAYRVLVE